MTVGGAGGLQGPAGTQAAWGPWAFVQSTDMIEDQRMRTGKLLTRLEGSQWDVCRG